jgi:aminoglycoside phosphotransferase (APT) family kinase protein
VVGAEQLGREEVLTFLGGQPGTPKDLEALSGGAWSSAWAYRAGSEELVVRFGPEVSWYEADQTAMAFAGPDLPVPQVREVGTTPSGRAYAISVRHHGRFLEDTPVEQAAAIAPTLTRLLIALYRVPAAPDAPVVWHQGAAPEGSWREYLLAGLADDPGKLVHGWSAALAADPELAVLSKAVAERVRTLAAACPERRDLVHGDLLHGNVLVSPDARRVEAVLSWKCSVRGDFLYDAAWCSFWSPWHPGIAAADPLSRLLRAPAVRAEPGALLDAAARHHCYELHIGFTHLGWNVWTGNQADLAATAGRLAEVLDRGPLRLTDD